jgi:hypothetical protein
MAPWKLRQETPLREKPWGLPGEALSAHEIRE